MATFNVRKDGSGTHTTITAAYMAASPGDTINIGEGTFTEAIEVYKNNLTFVGAGKDKTIIQGNYSFSPQQVTGCSWTSGNNFFTYTQVANPTFIVGMSIGETGLAVNSPGGAQISQIDLVNKKIYINKNFTNSLSAKVMKHWGRTGTIELRASGFTMSGIKVIDAPASSSAVEIAAMWIGSSVSTNTLASKFTGTSSSGFYISDCEFVADGDYAMGSDSNTAIGNGTVTNCVFSGKSFPGVNAVSGGVRNGVFFQNSHQNITFTNNKVDMICAGVAVDGVTVYGNQAVTIDAYGSVVSNNVIRVRGINPNGTYRSANGLALRMRGGSSTASNNKNKELQGLTSYGFLIVPTHANFSTSAQATNKTISAGQIVWKNVSGDKFYKCKLTHVTGTTAAFLPETAGSLYWDLIPTANVAAELAAAGYGYYQKAVGTNTTIDMGVSSAVQPSSGQALASRMDKDQIKQLPKVSSSSEFSSESNWHLVSVVYKKVGSSQRLVSGFKNFSDIKSLKLRSGMASSDQFELHRIILSKADKTMLVLKREDITDASDMDFVLK